MAQTYPTLNKGLGNTGSNRQSVSGACASAKFVNDNPSFGQWSFCHEQHRLGSYMLALSILRRINAVSRISAENVDTFASMLSSVDTLVNSCRMIGKDAY